MDELKNKIAIITGGSGDIGIAAILKFIEEGSSAIIIADLDINRAERIIKNLKLPSFCNCMAFKTDVSNYNDIKNLFKFTIDTFGTIDILVNCAGICPIASLEEIGEKEWDNVMDINLKSTYLCSREAIAIMKEKRSGKIINISSVSGRMGGIATGINYATSKGGIITLTMSLAKICGPYNINVNCVAPGTIDSKMTKTWNNDKKQDILRNIPLGRFGTPEDVANVITFLASEKSNYMSGAVVDVNGGLFMG
jgi:3-oxoacyl-[acyl-carrier protein] reductase